ncbi:class I SAM-dependent methyltransferase [Sabulilitoribacter arenilitoris]|uniref:Class I SAM-dependent methyltransferase n=1 Tax=Wocania arenilitoris TaxID=2044858 RepID=A0AAE3EPG5_9FLAO|nr:class I SAM-dependent methyltransferase [Wocania arenilitoris]MCF7569236.1 class I SAM-dependent methyltransferase [Wocania arenilitoris]
MKGIVKANTVDKYLCSIRFQIVKLVESNSTVIEYGCGNGDLLFKLSVKIKEGIGVDKSKQLISFAKNQVIENQIKNLEFRLLDVLQDAYSVPKMDYSIVSLLFHILPWEKSVELVEKLIATSETIIICGFCKPNNIKQKILLWCDQRFTGHYSNFLNYSRNGFTEGLLNSIKHIKYNKIDTFDPVIKIYKITKEDIN